VTSVGETSPTRCPPYPLGRLWKNTQCRDHCRGCVWKGLVMHCYHSPHNGWFQKFYFEKVACYSSMN
jgi:hypothetical protein